jgi:ribosome-associated toxin RatA of RatAB toxin-antitoxin module
MPNIEGVGSRRFEARTFIAAEPEEAFDWIADYRNVPRVLEGVSRWEPLTRKKSGVGARFDVEMRTLGVPLTSQLELTEWDPPHRIAWSSRGGLIDQQGAWNIEPERGGTAVELTIDYTPPAAAIGNLLAGPVERLARGRLQKALDRMDQYLREDRV